MSTQYVYNMPSGSSPVVTCFNLGLQRPGGFGALWQPGEAGLSGRHLTEEDMERGLSKDQVLESLRRV